jgi:ATP-binding cassette subfamily B protein
LLITDQLSAVRDADLIAVLHDGTVAEHRTHRELIAHGGRYSRLFRVQASGYQSEPRCGDRC